MKRPKPSHKNIANTARYQAMLELRRSSATSPQVPVPLKGTRRNKNTKAINDSREEYG